MRNAESVKVRLKNYAKKNNRVVQDVFTVYVLERTLYRISVSRYRDKFTLKGGILLHGILQTVLRVLRQTLTFWEKKSAMKP